MANDRETKFDPVSGCELSLFGAFPSGGTVDFCLRLGERAESADLVIHADGWNTGSSKYYRYPLAGSRDGLSFRLRMSFSALLERFGLREEGLFYYHYAVLRADGETSFLGGESPTELSVLENFVGERQLIVYRDGYATSESFTEGPVYHIFVDRFRSSRKYPVRPDAVLDPDWENGTPQFGDYPGAEVANNVFFGGDLDGVAEKLDYIASLGVKTVYLSPIFEAYSNHKYDVGDYLTVDSMFGGDEAFARLCEKAKTYGIRVILDGVFNHTGADSVYFNRNGRYPNPGAAQSQDSPYYPWYSFRSYPDEYECWWGVKILPRVDSASSDFRSFIGNAVAPKWMRLGASGWRLDVADELANEFLDDFRTAVKKQNPDAVIIGEVWEDASDKVSYGFRRRYLTGGQLDSVMNYPLRNALIEYVKSGNTELFRRYTEGTYRRYPKPSSDTLLNFLGTHDTERILTLLGGEPAGEKSGAELAKLHMTAEEKEKAVGLLKLAYAILAGLPGVPCIFYGDEAGMEGYRDPFCRRPFPWHNRNEELLAHYRKIGAIRKGNPVFRHGLFRLLSLTPDAAVYVREPFGSDDPPIAVAACRKGEVNLRFTCPVKPLLSDAPVGKDWRIGENEVEYFLCPDAWQLMRIE